MTWMGQAQAHVLEADGNVSAVLHMPPDDTPVAGKPTDVRLAFNSSQPDFDITAYKVTVSLLRNDTRLATSSLQADSGSTRDGSAQINFPEAGAYRLRVKGEPVNSGQAFDLYFSVRAIAGPGMKADSFGKAGADFWVLSAGSLLLLVIIARSNIQQGKRYR
jgi:hypothetical protein